MNIRRSIGRDDFKKCARMNNELCLSMQQWRGKHNENVVKSIKWMIEKIRLNNIKIFYRIYSTWRASKANDDAMTIVKWLLVHFRLLLITLFSSLSVKSSFSDIRSPYLSSKSRITPFVQPKPIWTSYSPPPPCPPGTLASYWNYSSKTIREQRY